VTKLGKDVRRLVLDLCSQVIHGIRSNNQKEVRSVIPLKPDLVLSVPAFR
jgi:hypothetical protein